MRFIPLLLLVVCGCVTDTSPDFRGVRWGSTLDQVIEAEGRAPDIAKDEQVTYVMKYVDLDAAVTYHATGDRVYRASITILQDEYPLVEAYLEDLYGEITLIETGRALDAGIVAGTFATREHRRTIIEHVVVTFEDGTRLHYVNFSMSDQ